MVIQYLLTYFFVYCVAFEDFIFAGQDVAKEVVEQGKIQYQILQERGGLPKYGACWKAAVVSIEEGCRFLSEETQSDMSLRMTNCFLEMSGHETYNCELDKKPNLKEICINSMTDRAFNVYTEFYTHVQNICWFLRGQVWHEIISENSLKVSKQMEDSVKNQETILASQRQSLELQEKLLEYGSSLEKIMQDFQVSTQHHQEVLKIMANSLGNLQSWLIGELFWFELSIFYISIAIFIGIFTSSANTVDARLPILVLFILSITLESLLCAKMTSNIENDIHVTHNSFNNYAWIIRKVFLFSSLCIIIYKAYRYINLNKLNNKLLQNIYNQNVTICENLTKIENNFHHTPGNVSLMYEDITETSYNNSLNYNLLSNNSFKCEEVKKIQNTKSNKNEFSQVKNTFKLEREPNFGKYNLRSKQNTPDVQLLQ